MENTYDPRNSSACEIMTHSLSTSRAESPIHNIRIIASILRCIFPDGMAIIATVADFDPFYNYLDDQENRGYNPLANCTLKC